MTRRTIAVTGASGNVGGAVVRNLSQAGHTDIVALSREPSRVAARQSVAVRRADYASREDMAAALTGIEALVFVSSDGEAAPMLLHHINVLDAAVRAGVEYVVYLSILDVGPDAPFCFAPVHRETERMLRDSGLEHAVVRASIYGEFFSRWLVDAAASGELALPMGRGRVSLVSREDVARCLAACVLRRSGALVRATGPRGYDLADLAALAGRFSARPVRATDPAPEEYSMRSLRQGLETWWVHAFGSMFASVREQRFAAVTDDVAGLTGRAPIDAAVTTERAFLGDVPPASS